MFDYISDILTSLKTYFNSLIFGDKDENELRNIYKENNIDLNDVYRDLKKINWYIYKENDYIKILNYLNRELKYENDLLHYEKVLDLELEINDKVKRIELVTNLNSLKKTFEKMIEIKTEYYKNNNKSKDI